MCRLRFKRPLLFLLLTLWFSVAISKPGPHPSFEATGTVVANNDGDTIKLQTVERGVIVVRLSGADAPETGQAYWRAARSYLQNLVAGQEITAHCYKQDKYEREVCHLFVGNLNVCEELIRKGFAWFASMYGHELAAENREAYSLAEQHARTHQIGLWSESNPMPPWECRKIRKTVQKCR